MSVWICKDGTEVEIKNMTDSHLINTIKYLERTGRDIEVYGCLDESYEPYADIEPSEVYIELKEELNKRKEQN